MNVPVLAMLQAYLAWLGSTTTALGNGSVGLIAAPFTGNVSTTLGGLTEASYQGYARQALGTSTVTFIGSDGNVYVEFSTLRFQPTGSASPNTIYGAFYTPGNSTTTVWQTDGFAAPVYLAGQTNQITYTPRCGLSPNGNFGLSVISS